MIYIILFGFLFIISLFEINIVIDRKNSFFFFCLVIMVIFIGGRDGNGADYGRYAAIFSSINTENFWKKDDPAFSAIALSLKTIGCSSKFQFLIFAAIQMSLIGYYILRYSRYRFSALLVYYSLYMFPFGFNAIAQGISVGIILCSIKMIEEKKVLKSLFMGLLAILFHRIGYSIVIMYIVYNMKFTRRNLLCLITGLFGISFVLNYCFTNDLLTTLLPSTLQTLVRSYNSHYVEKVSVSSIAARGIMLIFVSLMFKRYNQSEKRTYLVYWAGIIIYIILASNDLLATRINLSLKILEITLINVTLGEIRDRKTKSIMLAGLSIFLLAVLISAMKNSELYPYHSWIFGT